MNCPVNATVFLQGTWKTRPCLTGHPVFLDGCKEEFADVDLTQAEVWLHTQLGEPFREPPFTKVISLNRGKYWKLKWSCRKSRFIYVGRKTTFEKKKQDSLIFQFEWYYIFLNYIYTIHNFCKIWISFIMHYIIGKNIEQGKIFQTSENSENCNFVLLFHHSKAEQFQN